MRFPRVFEHFFSVELVRSCFFADFACVAILLFSGPKLEVLLFFSTLYAGRAVSTAFSRVIRRFFVAVSVLSQSIRKAVLTAFLRGFRRLFVAVTAFLRVIRRLLFLYFRRASMCRP